MSMKITGDIELTATLRRLGADMQDAVDKGVFVTAHEVRTTAIKSIQSQSAGRMVSRSRQGGGVYAHIAASAGAAPNTDTGKLVASIAVEKESDAHYTVGSNLDYSAWLEMGTSKMLPRPWLEPALRANINNLRDNIVKTANLAINKASK